MRLSIASNAQIIATDMRAIGPRARTAVFGVIRGWARKLQTYVAQNKLTSGGILEPRTGTLRRSLFNTVQEDVDRITATVGADLGIAPYARVQEFGGVVSGKNGKLTIPIDQALTAKGVPRFTARQLISNPHAFGFDGTFTAKGIIFGKIGRLTRESAIVPLFVLKDSVTLPAREYLASSLEENLPDIKSDAAAALAGALRA